MFGREKSGMPGESEALAGRDAPVEVPAAHFVNGNPLVGPFPDRNSIVSRGRAGFRSSTSLN